MLEILNLRAKNERCALDHSADSRIDFGLYGFVLCFKVYKGNHEKKWRQNTNGLDRRISLLFAAQGSRRVSRYCGISGHIIYYDGSGSDQRVLANGHAAQDSCPTTDAGTALDCRRDDLPVRIGLQRATHLCGTRILVIDKDDAVTDKDFVLDRHPFTNKRVARDFAVATYPGASLNLDERTDLAAVTNFTTVKVDKVMNDYIAAELNVGRY